jgi:aspartyl-tRNA(Asn)/glutamyl-tRNA(Gln) amidotransferase subunit A
VFSVGSETTASILGPASACGVAGLRPTYGRVSRYGAMPLSWTMDKLGPIGRSVADCATVFQVIHGADPRDPTAITAPFSFDPKLKMTGRRIGLVKREFDQIPANARPAYENVLRVLRDLGCTIEEIDLPDYPYNIVSRFVWQVEGGTVFEAFARKGELQEALINKNKWLGWKAAMLIPSADYMKVLRIRHAICLETAKMFQRFDALIAPRNPNGARLIVNPPNAPADDGGGGGGGGNGNLGTLGNVAGLPGVSVVCGFTELGLPMSLNFVGAPMTDGKILEIAYAYEQATSWHERRPTFVA